MKHPNDGVVPTLSIRTPEGIAFHLLLAGTVPRFLAWLIDGLAVLAGNGPCNKERLGARVKAWNDGAWFREGLLAHAEKAAKAADLTLRQAALAFLVRDPAVVAIPKAEHVAHVRENADGDVELPKDVVEQLDEAFQVRPGLRTV